MADTNKTEQATPRRLEKSREKGQVAYSADLTAGVSLLAVSLTCLLFTDWFFAEFQQRLIALLSTIRWGSDDNFDWMTLPVQSVYDAAILSVPFVSMAGLATLITGGLTTGFRVTPLAMELKLSRLDPKQGFSRIFSSRSVVRGVMAVLKLIVLVAIVLVVLRWRSAHFGQTPFASGQNVVRSAWDLTMQIAVAVSAALVLIGLMDFMYQKWKHLADQRMARHEVLDEHREDEGDPHLRARLKKLHREMSQRRMLQDVPSSTVVITNPTHLAIAITYERGQVGPPIVVAKGADHMARKIIEVARAQSVPIVERKPLARMLFAAVEVGSPIPLELYEAVAEVLAYIYQLDQSLA